jgi:uncharacterized protein (DUF58 family)
MSTLKKILIKTRRQIFSEIAGNNPSIFQGEGFDFVELREYNYGDDIRHIDWNVTARMQKPFVKIFKEERELNIVVVSLLGGSVYFGRRKFKQESIAETVALLGYSAIKNGDQFSSFIYTNKLETVTPPSKNIHSVQKATKAVLEYPALGKEIDTKNLPKLLFDRIKRRSIIFVIGDFFETFDFRLLAKKHEVIALVVRDHLEEQPEEMGLVNLYDPQTRETALLQVDTATVQTYAQKVHAHDLDLFKRFRKNQIAFAKIYTDDEPFVKLSKLFIGR